MSALRESAAARTLALFEASPGAGATQASPLEAATRPPCAWCGGSMEGKRPHAKRCGKTCRQTASRLRTRHVSPPAAATDARPPIRVAYADPPYPGTAKRYYGREPEYAGEIDHAALIAELMAKFPDGWALSTSMKALRAILPLCPEGVRVCPWVKPNGVSRKTYGLHNACEALLVYGGRAERPGVRDFLYAKHAIRGGTLKGRKPLAFCAFLFRALGLHAGDELVVYFSGTGVIERAAKTHAICASVAEILVDAFVARSSSDTPKRRSSTSRRMPDLTRAPLLYTLTAALQALTVHVAPSAITKSALARAEHAIARARAANVHVLSPLAALYGATTPTGKLPK